MINNTVKMSANKTQVAASVSYAPNKRRQGVKFGLIQMNNEQRSLRLFGI